MFLLFQLLWQSLLVAQSLSVILEAKYYTFYQLTPRTNFLLSLQLLKVSIVIIIIVNFGASVIIDQMESLGIASFGMSVTTMEEVFIKVGEKKEETMKAK